MDTFIPNMTLANIMQSNSNTFFAGTHYFSSSSFLHHVAKGVVSVTVMRTRRS